MKKLSLLVALGLCTVGTTTVVKAESDNIIILKDESSLEKPATISTDSNRNSDAPATVDTDGDGIPDAPATVNTDKPGLDPVNPDDIDIQQSTGEGNN